MRKQYF